MMELHDLSNCSQRRLESHMDTHWPKLILRHALPFPFPFPAPLSLHVSLPLTESESWTHGSTSPTPLMIVNFPLEAACTICFSMLLLILLESCYVNISSSSSSQ